MENNNAVEEISMMIITHSGTAKSSAMEAINVARSGDFKCAKEMIIEANKSMHEAGKEHHKALQMDINGDLKINLLFIHAEDQMLNAETTITLSEEIIELWKHIKKE